MMMLMIQFYYRLIISIIWYNTCSAVIIKAVNLIKVLRWISKTREITFTKASLCSS